MAPIRSRGGLRGRGRGRGRAGLGLRGARKDAFRTARIGDPTEDVSEPSDSIEPQDEGSDLPSDSSSDDGEATAQAVRPYNTLLQSLQQSVADEQPRRKRRKLDHSSKDAADERTAGSPESDPEPDRQEDGADIEDVEGDGAVGDGVGEADAAEEEDEDASDPFEVHFANPDDNVLSRRLKLVTDNVWNVHKTRFGGVGSCLVSIPEINTDASSYSPRPIAYPTQLKLKRRLMDPAQRIVQEFDDLEKAIAPPLFDYVDLLFGARTVQNAEKLRRLACLHALNHVFKTRDRVIKNNARLSREQEDQDIDLRDQGFTRPKVLILLETRQSCVRAVETMLALCEPEQQENKKRFQDAYVQNEDKFSDDKPPDFRELFEGNDDNEFRIGIKFTRKTVKFFSQFYNSDIIFASPLGLRRAIEPGDAKKRDYDFLSSVEVVVVDQADAMLMQNWEHFEFVFSHLNLQPRDAHGCDFSRVRSWYLDGHAKYLRQTIVFSAYLTPELNSLFSKHMLDVFGKVKYQPTYEGAMLNINLPIKQTFSRFDSTSPATDPDARFKYFTTAIVPAITRLPKPADGAQGILIFIPSYLDFVRVRNYFSTSAATQNTSFGAVSEYTEQPDVRRARSHFFTGRHAVLLYTGRAHHFRRYHIRGAKRVFMYALPDNPIFYEEIVGGFLGASISEGKVDASEAGVRVLFSKWDGLKLERVVGSKRVGNMLKEKGGDTFDFV